jgi:RNA polymerase sigma-70 factor (ECF subfamily)
MNDERSESEPAADDELVMRAGTDREAFGRLFDRYYPRVLRYCMRRLFERTAAEDVTSEVFLRVASHLGGFRGRSETDFRRWVFGIATNAVGAHLRQSRRRGELWKAAARGGRLDREADSAASASEHERLDWPAVYEGLMELDEREQTIVALRFFADCSHEEIGDVVGSSAGAVRTALCRALTRLREKLDPARRARRENVKD